MIHPAPKLYVIGRSDLPLSYQVPQSMHAAMDLAAQHPKEHKLWYDSSNTLVVLGVPNELALFSLAERLEKHHETVVRFHEPDVGDELTSIAVLPSPNVGRLLSGIPLAGKKPDLPTAHALLSRKREVVRAMSETMQHPTQNTLEHGVAVWEMFQKVLRHLEGTEKLPIRQSPSWLSAFPITTLEGLLRGSSKKGCAPMSLYHVRAYATWHDCGKYMVREVNQDTNKVSYPGHAEASAGVWESMGGDPLVGDLILHDMDVHRLRPGNTEGIAAFAALPYALLHLLMGLSEVLANAVLFGGYESESFKMKMKTLDKVGRKVIELRGGEKKPSAPRVDRTPDLPG